MIEDLILALKLSPNNIPLKLHVAETFVKLGRLEEAEKEFLEALTIEKNEKGLLGLAEVYYAQKNFDACTGLMKEFLRTNPGHTKALLLAARSYFKENNLSEAKTAYETLLKMDESMTDPELDNAFRRGNIHDDDIRAEPELTFLQFVQAPGIGFNDVGGMEQIKKEIELKIIQPLKFPEIYRAYGKKAGGGILLYGPPGCGKTMIARATAGEVNARFINVSLNDILDMWIGNSEKNLHAVFEEARNNTPCVLFVDEIDALGASRTDMKQSAGRHLINQFLQELDGIGNNNDGVLILAATNTPWNLDPAFRRPGRFDRIIFVPPPDQEARAAILKIKLNSRPADVDIDSVSKRLTDFSGADIEAVIDIAIEGKLEESFSKGKPQPITTKDIFSAAKKHKASTLEWFSTAKNFALYANESGLYDDILHFMKIKK